MEDDKVDACSGALEMLNPRTKSGGMFEVTRQKAEQPLAEQRPKPQPAQSLSAPGYMEWLAANTRTSASSRGLSRSDPFGLARSPSGRSA